MGYRVKYMSLTALFVPKEARKPLLHSNLNWPSYLFDRAIWNLDISVAPQPTFRSILTTFALGSSIFDTRHMHRHSGGKVLKPKQVLEHHKGSICARAKKTAPWFSELTFLSQSISPVWHVACVHTKRSTFIENVWLRMHFCCK